MEITRELVLPSTREEVWEALTDSDRLEEWFANDVDFDLDRGDGEFRWDTGDVRRAVVEEATLEERLAIRWWDPDRRGDESAVVFVLEEVPEGTRLVVTETATGPRACAGEWSWALAWSSHVRRPRLLCAC